MSVKIQTINLEMQSANSTENAMNGPSSSPRRRAKSLFAKLNRFRVVTLRGVNKSSAYTADDTTRKSTPETMPPQSVPTAEVTTQSPSSQVEPEPKREPEPEPGPAAPVTMEVHVPDNVKAGDRIWAQTPNGLNVKLFVPKLFVPGTIITFFIPASVGSSEQETHAAKKIQSTVRASVARREYRSAADIRREYRKFSSARAEMQLAIQP